ncbi:TlpA family protein disulfide reductase [Carboxylicivirga sediminis]|uniref:TlpA family protein disulfide reductase n=1 Tax=Carboxylicivirga sediminis TaxID=2006564 RepID=A0A941F1W5_9BACT|nr:TlpA disulfide reductase family protein [Carboxylicivirga sediminis]MBR8534832.1 TlpA family protein disulfide reductase [Carboxylicivirga sediminis]
MKQLKLILATVTVGLFFLSFMHDSETTVVGLEEGDKAPVFQTEQIDGTPFNLENLKGKMVLLNFWASYDAQSRMNNYYLSSLYETYKQESFYKGEEFVVVSISLDRFKAPLNLAIEQDETSAFLHICDYQGTNGSISTMYNINEPVNILIDGEGRIVNKDAEYSKIEKSLAFLSAI